MTEQKTASPMDALAESIAQDVYSMHFAPGARITEADLTARYAVSRNTIREAIALLLSGGILIKVPNKGVIVRQITMEDIREIFTLRSLLEAEAVRTVTGYGMIPGTLFELAEKIRALNPETDWLTYMQTDIAFHETLVESAGSPRLQRLYGSILAEVKLCMYQSRSYVPLKKENADAHLCLLQAMEEDRLEDAMQILHHHMEQAIDSYEVGFQQKGATP